MTRQKRIAELAAQVDSLVVRADAADRAVMGDTIGRLMKELRAALPAIDNRRLVRSELYSHGLVSVGSHIRHENRLAALADRLAALSATEDDYAALAALDPADLALAGYTAPAFVQMVAGVLASF